MSRKLLLTLACTMEFFLTPLLAAAALLGRLLAGRRIDVGLGPLPLISHGHTKKALLKIGHSCETFVYRPYFITAEFDFRGDRFPGAGLLPRKVRRYLGHLRLFLRCLRRYRCLYIYFNGGPLGLGAAPLLRSLEPHLYRLAGVKVVVFPYGSDVQEMSRSPNLLFKHTRSLDYPGHRRQRPRVAANIDRWTRHADHVVAGCEWVDYLYYWDTLTLSHFGIDTEAWKPKSETSLPSDQRSIRILHAPNHRQVKGTDHFVRAVDELSEEGWPVELVLLEGVANEEIWEVMQSVDLVADQLIIGWYAMFALEAMAMEKPVLCYLREDLEDFYVQAGLVAPDEIPIIRCSPLTVKEELRKLLRQPERITEVGKRSRRFVINHHSLAAQGRLLGAINRTLGLEHLPGFQEEGSSKMARIRAR